MNLDVALARYAVDRFGIVTRAGCRALGLSDDQVDWRVAVGMLVPVHLGVYRHAAVAETFEGLLLAAVFGGGPLAAASGPSLMRLYGVRGEWSDVPEITVVGTAMPDLAEVRVRRIDALRPGDVHRRFGIPVLAPPVGLLLLGASAPPWKVESAVHDMVFQRFTTRPRLLDALSVYGGKGRRGTVAYRNAINSLDESGGATQTNFELHALRLIRMHGLGEPALQHRVTGGDGHTYKLDLAFLQQLVDVETDGDRWHLNLADRARDRARDAALRAVGWEVFRFGSDDIHIRTAATIRTLRRSLSPEPDGIRSIGQRTGVA